MLYYAGADPGFMIGGLVQEFGKNFTIGNGDHFIVEGDEYDTAFFDKGPKFLHYQPQIAIVTSIEFDHADIYDDLEAIKKSFAKLMRIMPENGRVIANFDDPIVREIVTLAQCPVIGYGQTTDATWVLKDLSIQPTGTRFSAFKNGKLFGSFQTSMPGRHNAMNSIAVLAVLDQLNITADVCRKSLIKFPGVRRRQEVRGEINQITIIDDFAHHPTAVRETLSALRAAYAGRRLIAVFEPRTNSSRRNIFQQDYRRVFNQADSIIIKEPAPLTNIDKSLRFSAKQLTEDLKQQGKHAQYFPNTDEIIDYLTNFSQENDVIAIMSNGGFDNIHIRLLERLDKNSN